MAQVQAHWVTGPIRSGTNWICSLFHPFVDIYHSDNETYRTLESRKVLKKYESFAFKLNEDSNIMDQIIKIFPNSKIFLVMRDSRDVVNSIVYPHKNSIPYRKFPAIDSRSKEFNQHPMEVGIYYFNAYIENYDNIFNNYNDITYLIKYEDLINNFDEEYKKMEYFIEREPDINKLNQIKKPIKTPNQQIWKTWTDEQKNIFKSDEKAMESLIKYGYEKNKDW